MNMEKKTLPILSVVLYVLAGILAVYSVWSMVNIADSIKAYMEQYSMTLKGNEYNIISSYMSAAGPYIFYAIVLAVLGWILQQMAPVKTVAVFEGLNDFAAYETTVDDSVDEASIEDAVNQFEASAEPASEEPKEE
jgi:hypothetical protein